MLGGGYLVNAPIKSITVPENRLRELRDFSGLAASVDELGLWQPITVTESGVLVSGRHRLEAAKSLGWEKIPAFVVEDDELRNRLTEIDENIKRLDLTVYEQSKHAAERERVLEALGQRAKGGGYRREFDPDTVSGSKTTAEIAQEAGMSEKSWQRRTKVGRSLGPATTAVLDQADPTEEKHRNFLNSTTQLNHIADISNKRGDEVAAEVARKVLTEGGASTFKAYEAFKAEAGIEEPTTVGEALANSGVLDLPPFDLSKERKAYYRISGYLVGLSKLDPEVVAAECESVEAATRDIRHAERVAAWFSRYREALEAIKEEKQPGALRRIK